MREGGDITEEALTPLPSPAALTPCPLPLPSPHPSPAIAGEGELVSIYFSFGGGAPMLCFCSFLAQGPLISSYRPCTALNYCVIYC
jgi:hypothetical protein